MSLSPGTRLGHYDVTALLGEGGMGQVWQATDTQLNRQVALKILPDAFSADPDRLARFTREAQILASLNHPNIAAIYGIEEAEGTRALVLELVEGPTLADRIAKGPIPLDEALPIAKQIAEALEAAHEAGVIHRDLKPANIKVREDGTVKVLDFGLAKALERGPASATTDPSQSPTLTDAATRMGMVIGTAAYMSPEQAAGKVVDRRADIWAFGAVLFEMLTGRPVFAGDTASETLASVMKSDPAWASLPSRTPHAIGDLLHRCLTKDPKRRLRDIGEARIVVDEVGFAPTERVAVVPGGPQPVARQRVVALFLSGIAASSFITGGIVWRATRPAPPPVVRFMVTTGANEELTISPASADVTISRDGRHIAYLTESGSEQHLWIHSLDQLTPRELVAGGLSREPFFSPDSTWLGFYDQTSSELKRVSVQGGSPLTIANVSGLLRGASWGDDDSIIFATLASDSGLWRVPASGGTPEQLSTPDPERGELDHLWPEILPGAGAVLFTITANPIEDSQIAVLSLETREHEVLVRGGSNPRYSPTGHLVYAADGALRVLRFDLGRLETTGDPVPVLEGVLTKVTGVADFSLSENGSLVYVPAGSVTRGRLVWVDRGGIRSPIEGEDVYGFPRLSPDGTRVALGIQSEEGGIDIRIRDFERGSDTRLTVQGTNIYPVWAPDGVTVTFASSRGAAYDLFSRPADLSGDTELLITTTATKIPGSWSPDGQVLVYYEVNPTTLRDIWMLPGDGDPAPFLVTPFNERAPRLSPDGRWMAYVSDQSGESNVYVQRFPDGGRVIPISTGGGSEAVWSRDGRALFYRSGSQMLAVEVDTTAVDLNVGRPSVIFEGTYDTDPFALGNANYDVSLDGERFLMVTGASAGAISELTVVQHWFEELKRLVPID